MRVATYKNITELTDSELIEIAILVRGLDPEFYDSFDLAEDPLIKSIVNVLIEPNSDLGNGLAIFYENQLAGFVCYFDYTQKKMRSVTSMKVLSKNSLTDIIKMKNCKVNILKFNGLIAPLNESCFYLNKILVTDKFQRSGVGRLLFKKFLNEAKSSCLAPRFHVRSENTKAINFYNQLGFYAVDSSYSYKLFTNG